MISLFGLTYRRPEYLVKSLDSIIRTASEPLEITVIDSHSHRSPEILEILQSYLEQSKIKRYISCKKNCRGYGFQWAFKNFTPKHSLTFLTDLDVIVPSYGEGLVGGSDWISATKRVHGFGGFSVALTSFPLDPVNYVPPNSGHLDSYDGLSYWLMGIDTTIYHNYVINNPNADLLTLDSNLVSFFRRFTTVKRMDQDPSTRSFIKLYHQAWDLWKDDPDYWSDKVKGINWFADKPSDEDYVVYG